MFKQISNLNGDEAYLIASLLIFVLFFAVVAIMLFFMKKDFIDYMRALPLEETDEVVDTKHQ